MPKIIKVHPEDWQPLGEEGQNSILKTLREGFGDDTIEFEVDAAADRVNPNPEVDPNPELDQEDQIVDGPAFGLGVQGLRNPIKELCKKACNVAATAAKAACLADPITAPLCIAGAEELRQRCREEC